MNSLVISRRLLWKDYRQLRPALIGCWAIMAVILLLICVRQLLAVNRETILPDAIMLVLAAPTLAAMAASGILIGHERQTRSWNWSSSLPISWSSSLISKSIIWLVSSAVMVGTLYLLFLILMQVCQAQGMNRGGNPAWITPQMVVTTVLIVPLIVYVCFSLAALLWNDTLTAFVGAAIAVSILYVLASDVVPSMIAGLGTHRVLDASPPMLGVISTLLLLVIATIFMMRAYRWRWTTGQLASIGWAQRLSTPVNNFQRRLLWQSAVWSGSASSEFGMLVTHSLRMAFWIRLMIFAGVGVLTVLILLDSPSATAVVVTIGGAAILGVTSFAGDQLQGAYKFLSDRGVSWRKLLIAHALPPLVLAMLPVLLLCAVESQRGLPIFGVLAVMFLALTALVFGLFCSLCTRMPTLSFCLTVGGMVAALMAHGMVHNFYYGVLHQYSGVPQVVTALMFLTQAAVLVSATIMLVKRWLVYDQVRGANYYLATLLLALVPTNLLAVGLCFLTVPNVPWQGVEESRVMSRSVIPRASIRLQLPIFMQNSLYSTDSSHTSAATEYGLDRLRMQLAEKSNLPLAEEISVQEGGLPGGTAKPMLPTVEDSLKQFEETLDRLPAGEKVDPRVYRLSLEVENSAWLGLYATQKLKNLELARRAWKVNRQLLALFDYSSMEGTQAIHCRFVSALLRKHMSGEDWEFLRTGGSLADLQPEPVSRETWSYLARMQATVYRANLRNQPLAHLLFPVRWFHERRIAYILQREIEAIEARPTTMQFTSYSDVWPDAVWPDARAVSQILSLEASLPR